MVCAFQNLALEGPSVKDWRESDRAWSPHIEGASILPKSNSSLSTTTIRFQCRRNIEMQLTPLAVDVASYLEEDMSTNVSAVPLINLPRLKHSYSR